MNLTDKIESTREQLNILVNNKCILTEDMVVKVSQQLDLLINIMNNPSKSYF